MAAVYKGLQLSLDRPVAIKVLLASLSDKPVLREHFDRESLIIARLINPHIINVIDRGLTSKGMPYFIMEYIDGTDLQVAIRKEELDDNRKLDLIIQVCKALSYAHKNGVIHRDIKPSNVLIDREGNARVLDFGIAQIFEETIHEATQTPSGLIMGTLPYMSPEQQSGAQDVSALSDLYSLGVMAYELFTGFKPKGIFQPPSELNPKIPSALEEVILSCMESEPEKRPASADEIKDSLLKILRGAHLHSTQRARASQGITKIEDKFALLDVIKEDGHGAVYLYEDKSDLDLLVIKKRASTSSGLTEAKLLTTLRHKNILNILGASKNDRYFIIVMEYLRGGNLKDRLIQPLPLPEVIRIMREMCEGLSFAHKNRIVHGNLRPSNIMFTESDHIKITDFGLDEHYDDQKEEANWYSREALMGSPQGDIFAIGTIIYQMLTGQLPVWKRRRLKPSKLFESNPANVQEIVINMLGVDQEGMDVNLDQVIAQIDDLGIISDKTMVLAGGAGTLSNKQNDLKLGRIFSLFIITNMILALSVVAYLAFTGQIEIDHKTLGTFLETTKEFFRHFWEQALAYSEKGMEFMRKVLGKTG